MFRSPNDVTSTSGTSSGSDDDQDMPHRGEGHDKGYNRTSNSEDLFGASLDQQETTTESIQGERQGYTQDGEPWHPTTTTEDHIALMTASSLEFMYTQIASERLNAEHGVTTFTRHSPEAQERGRQMYQQVSQQLARAGVPAGHIGGDQWRDVRQQYSTALEQLGTTSLEAPPNQDFQTALEVQGPIGWSRRPGPQRAISGLLMAPDDAIPNSFAGPTSLPAASIQYPTASLHSPLGRLPITLSQTSPSRPVPRYKAEFAEIKPLGRGGYGTVFHVVNFVDNQHYAIKKIPLNARRLRKWHDGGKEEIENILKEIRTLARLDHHNIVRYYGAWIDQTEPVPPPTNTRPKAASKSSSPFTKTNPPQALIEDDIIFEISSEAGDDKVEEITDSNAVIFGEDSVSQSEYVATTSNRGRARRPSHATSRSTLSRKSHVQSTGLEDDDEIESIPRSESSSQGFGDRTSTFGFANSEDIFTDGNAAPNSRLIRAGNNPPTSSVTLHIQMSLHPMSLSTYLLSVPANPTSSMDARHCYHILPSIKIILAIIKGVEYLHSQGVVHRDLKPGNIFLSTSSFPTIGCVEVGDCSDCQSLYSASQEQNSEHERKFITPRIGDFGLVAELISSATTSQDPTTQASAPTPIPVRNRSNTNESLASPSSFIGSPIESALNALTLSPHRGSRRETKAKQVPNNHRVGTEFYRPPIPTPSPTSAPMITRPNFSPVSDSPGTGTSSTIIIPPPSEKLDVFSLGVIFFELLYRFSTKMERGMVLGKLTGSMTAGSHRHGGKIPDGFLKGCGNCPDVVRQNLKHCIEGMVEVNDETRWDLTRVKDVLEEATRSLTTGKSPV